MANVSIIITCYNLGAYLDEALESALAQGYPDCDILLVDDGSTDPATQEAVARAAERPQVRLLQLDNGGVARARNLGIAATESQYVLTLDADDRIMPDYVAKAVAVLDAQPEVGFVGCHFQTFGLYDRLVTHGDYDFPALLVENTVPSCAVMRRVCWEAAGGFRHEMNGFEDWDLWISIVECGYKGYVIPEVLYEYRIRQESNLTQNSQPDVFVERMRTLYTRHRQSYERSIDEVLMGKDRLFNQIRSWHQQQRIAWLAEKEHQANLIAEQQGWIAQLVEAREWHKRQSAFWQAEAERPWYDPLLRTFNRFTDALRRQRLWRAFNRLTGALRRQRL